MNDIELQALSQIVRAEVSAMNTANTECERNGYAMAYDDLAFTSLDCVRCLDAELRRRKVLVTP